MKIFMNLFSNRTVLINLVLLFVLQIMSFKKEAFSFSNHTNLIWKNAKRPIQKSKKKSPCGNTVDDLCASLEISNPKVEAGESVYLLYRIRNVGHTPRLFTKDINTFLSFFWMGHVMVLQDEQGTEIELIPETQERGFPQIIDTSPKRKVKFKPGGSLCHSDETYEGNQKQGVCRKKVAIWLMPGEEFFLGEKALSFEKLLLRPGEQETEQKLKPFQVQKRPGTYLLHIEYRTWTQEQMNSNTIRLTILPK